VDATAITKVCSGGIGLNRLSSERAITRDILCGIRLMGFFSSGKIRNLFSRSVRYRAEKLATLC
jgi:hypothetical protein